MCKEGYVKERGSPGCHKIKELQGVVEPSLVTIQVVGVDQKEEALRGCMVADYRQAQDDSLDGGLIWHCIRCKPNHRAVPVDKDGAVLPAQAVDKDGLPVTLSNQLSDAWKLNLFVCKPADQELDANYSACMDNHPGRYTYQKWYQVIWKLNLVKKGRRSKWWKHKHVERQHNKWWTTNAGALHELQAEEDLVEDTPMNAHKLRECQK